MQLGTHTWDAKSSSLSFYPWNWPQTQFVELVQAGRVVYLILVVVDYFAFKWANVSFSIGDKFLLVKFVSSPRTVLVVSSFQALVQPAPWSAVRRSSNFFSHYSVSLLSGRKSCIVGRKNRLQFEIVLLRVRTSDTMRLLISHKSKVSTNRPSWYYSFTSTLFAYLWFKLTFHNIASGSHRLHPYWQGIGTQQTS